MKGILKSLWAGAKRRGRLGRAWFRDGGPLWIWLAVAAAMLVIPYVFAATLLGVPIELADRLRWSGMLFQFAGLAMVVVGLNLSRQVFEQSSIWKAIVAWLGRARYMVVPPKPVNVSATAQAGAALMAGGEATVSVGKGTSIEDRVARLEEDLKRLDGKLAETKKDVGKLRSETNEKIDKERSERRCEDQKISKRLETAAIGGIHLELAGVAYLVVGIALASVPDESAGLLRALGL
jgi:hypothetical protein